MIQRLKRIVRDAAPRASARWVKALLGRDRPQSHNFWTGDFEDWREAFEYSSGYDDGLILAKVRESLLAVMAGRGAFERDSVLFEKPEYVWSLVAMLARVAAENDNRLNVLDFGGSLGSSYFQHRACFDWVQELTWCVVEQEHFVTCGREEFEDDDLKFFNSLDECLANHVPSVILFSGVLPYLEDPYAILQQVVDSRLQYVLIDRTPYLLTKGRERLTVQTVPPAVYTASYPAWFFDREKLMGVFADKFSLVTEYDADEGEVTLAQPHDRAQFCGWFFKRK